MSLTAGRPRPGDPSSAPAIAAARSERQLLRMSHDGDIGAREELVHRFLPLTRRLAGRYRHSGLSQDDLEQVASLGLIKAIDRYDPDRGPFVRYAAPNIVGELKRHFRDRGWDLRIPRSLQERSLAVSQAVDELPGQLGRSPTPTDIAGHTGLDLEQVLEALEASSATRWPPLTLPASRPTTTRRGRWVTASEQRTLTTGSSTSAKRWPPPSARFPRASSGSSSSGSSTISRNRR
jgi:RNA polymerase sigma-B factor